MAIRYQKQMGKEDTAVTRALVERLARLSAADDWHAGLNPSQIAALSYLSRANRFSRAPSHLADYLGATRGTISQTLKSLLGKGLVGETRSPTDRRSLRFDLTDPGRATLARTTVFDDALARLNSGDRDALRQGLAALLRSLIAGQGGRPFGICRTCRHHEIRGAGGYCRLLDVPLEPFEADQICHEQKPRDAA